jgi:DNA-binding CsgD family transcriptional regulator
VGGEAPVQLVGRERELASMERALDTVSAGTPSVLAVTGEPGIGKTALLEALGARAEARELLVLSGRAAEFERGPPFATFVDALDDYLGTLNPRLFENLDRGSMAELASVFPSLAQLVDEAAQGLPDERYRAHRAVGSLLELLGRRRPVVLVLDDAQWADEASIELVAHLARRRPKGRLLLAVGYRTHQAPSSLVAALTTSPVDGRVLVKLRALSPVEVDELLGESVPADARSVLHRESGGNPFYLRELLRAEGMDAGKEPSAARVEEVPAGVIAALGSELGQLRSEAQRMLEGAALVGDPFDPELAGVAASLDESRALVLLDELLDSDLIRETELPRRFRFRHPIVRRAVYESAKPGWRVAAHGRLAATLEDRGASPGECAHHVECSAPVGDDHAVMLLTQAGRAAAPRAPSTAAHWFDAALRLLPSGADDQRLQLLAPMASALGAAGRIKDSRDALREATALVPRDAGTERARLTAACATMEFLLGGSVEARSQLVGALDELPDQRSPEAGTLKLALAWVCLWKLDYEQARGWAQDVLEQALADGDRALEATARVLSALWEARLGTVAGALKELDAAAATFDRLDDSELAPWLLSFARLGMAETMFERPDSCRRHMERALAVARSSGQGYVLVEVLLFLGDALQWQGDLRGAVQCFEDAIASAELTGENEFLLWALGQRCWSAVRAGDLGAASAAGERAVELSAGRSDQVSAVVGFFLAAAQLEAGDPAGCRERMLEAGGGPDLPLNERVYQPRWYGILTRAELALGQLEQAEAWAERAETAADGLGLPGRTGWARHARAEVMLARGDAVPAADLALAAADSFSEAENRIDAERARILHGVALAEVGDRAPAITALEQARTELEACGALGLRDQAARELRRLGRRVPRRTRASVEAIGALSPRELEIAQLVHQGRTNKQIANALYLSARTVETHLTHAYRKLGVPGRSALAAAVEREGSAGPT